MCVRLKAVLPCRYKHMMQNRKYIEEPQSMNIVSEIHFMPTERVVAADLIVTWVFHKRYLRNRPWWLDGLWAVMDPILCKTIDSQTVERFSALRTDHALLPRNIFLLLVLICVRGWVNLRAYCCRLDYANWKNSFTSSDLELVTFRPAAQCFNHYTTTSASWETRSVNSEMCRSLRNPIGLVVSQCPVQRTVLLWRCELAKYSLTIYIVKALGEFLFRKRIRQLFG
jgi:hypothetical protein